MIRIICARSDAAMAANVGGPVTVTMKTFDIAAPELETWLLAPRGTYEERTFTGIEFLGDAEIGGDE